MSERAHARIKAIDLAKVRAAPGVVAHDDLHAPVREDRWGPIKATDGGVLEARSSGVLTLPVGVTAAVYRAAHPGTARLSSRRPPCGATTSACDAAHRWSARVVVR